MRAHSSWRVRGFSGAFLTLAFGAIGCESPRGLGHESHEAEPSSAAPAAEVERKEGGTGTRAKAEQANKRYALQGPADSPSPEMARREALTQAREFGMIGLMDTSGSGSQFESSTEAYAHQAETGFVDVEDAPLSTFSADVDTASYANVRRFLHEGQLPPAGAVRIEEMLNYFSYDYPEPAAGQTFGTHLELAAAPWAAGHQVLQVGISTSKIDSADTPARNLVFLLDVSGSMSSDEKLGLVIGGLELLVRQLRPQDKVAIVAYAGASGVVLPPTSGSDKANIREALTSLEAGGSTNGASGILLAYELARRSFKKGAINRVILATDGDFNVGVSSESELVKLIEKERQHGVFLTVLGVGRGNLKDSTMEQLADKGNGNYAYLDSLQEAQKVLVREAGSTLHTVAKDVKFQIEFNPKLVKSYRLIGYDNRRLAAQDFNDDKKDAGDMGAGHQVTALYEIIPRQTDASTNQIPVSVAIDPLKYQSNREPTPAANDSELGTLKIRYKSPHGSVSRKIEVKALAFPQPAAQASRDLQFSLGLTQFGMILVDSKYRGSSTYQAARRSVQAGSGTDSERFEVLQLIDSALAIATREATRL